MIGVLDIDAGNLRSVVNTVDQGGHDVRVIDSGRELDSLSHLIIPGVGHFGAASRHLQQLQLVQPILEFAASGRPLLGLCVGMQLLATEGTEGGSFPGLGLVPGSVVRIPDAPGVRIPHVGWNAVKFHAAHPVFKGVKDERDFYFTHSFHLRADRDEERLATTDYRTPLTAIVGRGNVLGFQFHPEKSQLNGRRLIENFCFWDGRC
jgi:glutamine amidotransferase